MVNTIHKYQTNYFRLFKFPLYTQRLFTKFEHKKLKFEKVLKSVWSLKCSAMKKNVCPKIKNNFFCYAGNFDSNKSFNLTKFNWFFRLEMCCSSVLMFKKPVKLNSRLLEPEPSGATDFARSQSPTLILQKNLRLRNPAQKWS